MARLMDVKISTQGSLFRPNAPQIVRSEMTDYQKRIGLAGQRIIRQRLGHVLKHPTGHYESRIDYRVVTRNVGGSLTELHDSGVIYGPWLEGVGSRNARTRFKGYSTFRKITQRVNEDIESIVRTDVNRLAARLEA